MIEKILNMDKIADIEMQLAKYKIAFSGIIKICNALMHDIDALERKTNEEQKSNDRHTTGSQDISCEVCD